MQCYLMVAHAPLLGEMGTGWTSLFAVTGVQNCQKTYIYWKWLLHGNQPLKRKKANVPKWHHLMSTFSSVYMSRGKIFPEWCVYKYIELTSYWSYNKLLNWLSFKLLPSTLPTMLSDCLLRTAPVGFSPGFISTSREWSRGALVCPALSSSVHPARNLLKRTDCKTFMPIQSCLINTIMRK